MLRTVLLLCFLLTACREEWLVDAHHSTDRIRHTRELHVGVIDNPPMVRMQGERATGIEAQMITDFASSLGASPVWHPLDSFKAEQALEDYKLDIVIGGLQRDSHWKDVNVGLTQPYAEEWPQGHWPAHMQGRQPESSVEPAFVMAVPPGENKLLTRLERFLLERSR